MEDTRLRISMRKLHDDKCHRLIRYTYDHLPWWKKNRLVVIRETFYTIIEFQTHSGLARNENDRMDAVLRGWRLLTLWYLRERRTSEFRNAQTVQNGAMIYDHRTKTAPIKMITFYISMIDRNRSSAMYVMNTVIYRSILWCSWTQNDDRLCEFHRNRRVILTKRNRKSRCDSWMWQIKFSMSSGNNVLIFAETNDFNFTDRELFDNARNFTHSGNPSFLIALLKKK